MLGGVKHSATRPTAVGTLLQESCYGSVIPVIIGMTKSAPLAIWAANLRQGGACNESKKDKKKSKKGLAPPQYTENIDFLIAHNPCFGINQIWDNGITLPLNVVKVTATLGLGVVSYTIVDAHFYSLIGVTFDGEMGAQSFSDYGNPSGTVSYSANAQEIPMMNAAHIGPDPCMTASYLRIPWTYRWQPSYGTTIYLDYMIRGGPDFWTPAGSGLPYTFNFYYYQTSSLLRHKSPLTSLCLTWEPQCGDGPEYASAPAPYDTQQIIYPEYCGAGSPNIALGPAGILPQLEMEVQGSFMAYPTGDADFADMIEYVMKSGAIQAGFAPNVNDVLTGQAAVMHGLNANDSAFIVQRKYINVEENTNYISYGGFSMDIPVTAGNWLVVFYASAEAASATAITMADLLGNTWTRDYWNTVSGGTLSTFGAFHCQVAATGADYIIPQVGAPGDYHSRVLVMEINGTMLDTLDVIASNSGTPLASPFVGSLNITTGGTQKKPELIMAMGAFGPGLYPVSGLDHTNWTDLVGENQALTVQDSTQFDLNEDFFYGQFRTVMWPGTFTWKFQTNVTGTFFAVAYAFYGSQASLLPNPTGNILDQYTLTLCRRAAQAGGLWGSICMNSQRKASDWLKDFYFSMNAWPVWSGFRLKSIPRSEVSIQANGATYKAYTYSGPVAALDAANGDFVADANNAPIIVARKAQTDAYNLLQIQHVNRNTNYNQVITSQPEPASIALYGVRKAAPEVHNEIQDVGVARMLLGIMIRRMVYLRNTYSWKMNAKWMMLEPGDLITINDSSAGIFTVPVRIQSVEENEDNTLTVTAEPFIYGVHDPQQISIGTTFTEPDPYLPNTSAPASSVNAPIFIEAIPRLTQFTPQPQLWIVVSSSQAGYGGSQVEMSTDGGSTYSNIGTIVGNGTTGVLAADWPAHADEDSTNDLLLDLSESLGSLSSFAVADEDNFTYISWVNGGSSVPAAPSLSSSAGGSLGSATYYVKVTYVGPLGETLPSDESSLLVAANHVLVVTSPSASTGMTGYNVYVSTATGTETKQNASPITLGSNWTEPTSGLIAGSALPSTDSSIGIPYELMTYATAVLTSANHYTLKATGTGNHLRRGVFGAPPPATAGVWAGPLHAVGSRYAFLGPPEAVSQPGILKIPLDPKWIGVQLHFKFLAFNQFGLGTQGLTDATDYTYTPTGSVGSLNPNFESYSISGGALTNPTSTTIHMAQAQAKWLDGHSSNYNARTFTISAPTVPTTYYVTISDPSMVGDTGTSTNLTATCQTSNALVGTSGNVYIGSIVALPAGGGTATSPGGVGAPGVFTATQSGVQDEGYTYGDDTGAANAYVLSPNPPISAYAEGMGFAFKAANACSGASTLAVSGLAAKAIKKWSGGSLTDLATGDLETGQIFYVKYDGTQFQVMGGLPASSGGGGTPFGEVVSFGTSTSGTLSHTPNPTSFFQLTRNGIVLRAGGNDFTLSGTSITLTTAAYASDVFQAFYIY